METQTKSIIEQNEMIARFVRSHFDIEGRVSSIHTVGEMLDLSGHECNSDTIKVETGYEIQEHGFNDIEVKAYSYHNSWDWLMEVVEEINTMDDYKYSFIINYNYSAIRYNPSSAHIIDVSGYSTLESAYKAVVEFIEWYNENKQDNV